MTVSSTTSRVAYTGNGATTSFAVPFYFLLASDLKVYVGDVLQAISTNYSVTGADNPAGGTVTFTAAPGNAVSVVILRDPPQTQTTDYQDNDPFPAQAHERALDKLTMLVQRLGSLVSRSFTLPDSYAGSASTTLPMPQASHLVGWNSAANALQNVDPATLATVVAYGTAVADVFSGDGVQTQFTLTSSPGTLANLDVSVGGVTQLPTTNYTWSSGTTLTFAVAPPAGVPVLVRYVEALPQGTTDSAASTFLQAGVGAISRFVRDKLRETVVSVTDFGADPTGLSSSTLAIQAAINTGKAVFFPEGTYKAAGLTQSTAGQRLYATGNVTVQKNASGALLTSSGSGVEINGIGFRGDAATPSFTGDGLVFSGDNVRLINCGSRWMAGRAVKCTGNHIEIIGTCDVYQTTDTTANGYDIELGVSGTNTAYHFITGIYTSQATGGVLMTDTGSTTIVGGQFGKLTIAAGTSPAGVNGGNYIGCRILGDITVGLSSSTFAANTVGAVNVTFNSGTSGHSFGDSNVVANGATITDSSNVSYVSDLRNVPFQTYTPAWTAVTANPSLGDGTLQGYYSRRGRLVTATVRLAMGSTTTYGTGAWYITLPFAASTSIPQQGSCVMVDAGTTNYLGVVQPLQDGTARALVFANAAANNIGAAVPHTWASTDELRFTITYSV
jgi:hypothetical protein